MLLRAVPQLQNGGHWSYELLDGFRAVAFKTGGRVYLRWRNNTDFNRKHPSTVQALAAMPDDTIIDGEIGALDGVGRPSFSTLQNYTSGAAPLVYYVFDVMILGGKDLMAEPLSVRRGLLQSQVLAKLGEPIRESPELDAGLSDLIATVKAHGLEGLVGKAPRQPARTRSVHGLLAKDAGQSRAGVRNSGLNNRRERLRCGALRILRRRQTDLRRPHPKRLHAGISQAVDRELSPLTDRGLPVREPAGAGQRAVRAGADRR
jgi:bifunctional non-homologous end joining protein LigD